MNLFQKAQDALERRVASRSHDEAVLQQSNFWMRAITWSLMGTAAFGLGWLALAQTEEIVVASGKLDPMGAVKDIQMPVGGITQTILVKDGDQVKAGQVLMKLDTESSSQKLKSLNQNIALKEEQLRLKQVEMEQSIRLSQEEVTMLEQNLVLEQEILERFQKLSEQGASAELQYLQQRNRVQEVQGKLIQARIDRQRQAAIQQQATQQLKSELASLRSERTEAQVTLRYQELRSPVNGVVFDLKPRAPGYAAQSTESMMKIVPFDKLEANVEIPSNNIGFVRPGMKADISIDSFPATDFGVLQGNVKRIGSDALPPDPQKQRDQFRFPATIQLSSQQLLLRNGRQLPLQVGMSLTAHIKLRKVTYLQLLLSDFKDKADSLRRI